MMTTDCTVHVLVLQTEHFEFMALDEDEKVARRRLAIGFQEHLRTYGPEETRLSMTPANLELIRQRWADETFGQIQCRTIEQFEAAIDEWYGIRVSKFRRPSVVLRDGSPI